jgi:calmodulin
MLSPREVERCKVVFGTFDKDRDGIISSSALDEVLRAVGLNPTAEEVADIKADVGRKGVSLNAFLYIVYRHSRYVDIEDEIVKVFQVFDTQRTGTLPVDQVRKILAGARKPFTTSEIEDVLSHAEIVDGLVDYMELISSILAV